jgi:hypothetical protein
MRGVPHKRKLERAVCVVCRGVSFVCVLRRRYGPEKFTVVAVEAVSHLPRQLAEAEQPPKAYVPRLVGAPQLRYLMDLVGRRRHLSIHKPH